MSNNSKEKLSKFAIILSQLRKERGISQKKAATDLGISQALLSHYEKGIRECGLDFVIKCSEYYGVTTDYLLGLDDTVSVMPGQPISVQCIKLFHEKPVWSSAHGWMLVNAINENINDYVGQYNSDIGLLTSIFYFLKYFNNKNPNFIEIGFSILANSLYYLK